MLSGSLSPICWVLAPSGVLRSDCTQDECAPQQLTHSFLGSLLCCGEGNGNPLQYSCLENPRDGGAWWAAVSGVAQSRTRLKQLSSLAATVLWAMPKNVQTTPLFHLFHMLAR